MFMDIITASYKSTSARIVREFAFYEFEEFKEICEFLLILKQQTSFIIKSKKSIAHWIMAITTVVFLRTPKKFATGP